MEYIVRRRGDEEKAFQILTMQGKSEEEDLRVTIRDSLMKQAMGIDGTLVIAEELPVALGDPISYHPDDEMVFEIGCPQTGRALYMPRKCDWLQLIG